MGPPSSLALAAASQRLRRRPGRPRNAESRQDGGGPEARASRKPDSDGRTLAMQARAPRLLDLRATATYLGVSEWTVRDLDAVGVLRRVRVPLPNGGELRKLLFDREDLDRLIQAWKDARL